MADLARVQLGTGAYDVVTKTYVDNKIASELSGFDKLDYKVADSAPTPTTVVINGQTVPTETGVRYLVAHTTDDAFEEYVLIDGTIYDIGSTSNIDLSGYATETYVDDGLAVKADGYIETLSTSITLNEQNQTAPTMAGQILRVETEPNGTLEHVLTQTDIDGIAASGSQTGYTVRVSNANAWIDIEILLGGTYYEDMDGAGVTSVSSAALVTETAHQIDARLVPSDPTKQDTLVSGTNIKTINGQNLIGSGNLILHQGVGDGLDVNDMPSWNELSQMFADHALLYIDGNWLVTGIFTESTDRYVTGEWADTQRTYAFSSEQYGDSAPLVYKGSYTETPVSNPAMIVAAGGSQPYARFSKGSSEEFYAWGLENQIILNFKDSNGATANRTYTITPSYEMSDNDTGGNVVQVGNLTIEGTTYGIYEFYYKTGLLPNTTSAEYNLTNLLANYTVNNFIDATGITENGTFIGSGRTDNNNRVIVQQFSKNNKKITLRTYQDFSSQRAILKVKFYGTKNA